MSERFFMFGWDIKLLLVSLKMHKEYLAKIKIADSYIDEMIDQRMIKINGLIVYLQERYKEIYGKSVHDDTEDGMEDNIGKREVISDPVCRCEGKWYFYDETWSDRYGPYESEEVAREALDKHCKEHLGDEK